MGPNDREYLPYRGESPQDRLAYEQYLADVKRGKSSLQLTAVATEMTPEIRRSWSARSFTGVSTPEGEFDAVVCNVSYHFHTHGQRHGSIHLMTQQAKRYFEQHHEQAVDNGYGLLRLPDGSLFECDGRIVTYVG
jgi:hypothetical protein